MSGVQKLICCILPRGKGLPLLDAASHELGVVAGHVHLARGLGRATPQGRRAFGETAERDVISVVVPGERADEVFEFFYRRGGIDQPHGGFVYQRALAQASEYVVPDLAGPSGSAAPAATLAS